MGIKDTHTLTIAEERLVTWLIRAAIEGNGGQDETIVLISVHCTEGDRSKPLIYKILETWVVLQTLQIMDDLKRVFLFVVQHN